MGKKQKDEQTITAEDVGSVEDVMGEMGDPGEWEKICIIAMAQDVDESGNLLMSQSKVMLEQHSKTMIIRTVPV